MHKKGISLNFVEKSLSHSTDKIRRRTFLFRKTSGIEKFQAKEGWSFAVLSKMFSSHRTEKTSPGNHSVFQKISGRENFLWKRWGVSGFSVKVFVSLYRNISLENTLVFQKNSFTENFHAWEGGRASRFCPNLLSHRTETKSFVKEPLWFREISWYQEEFMDSRGLITIFSRIFLSHNARNFLRGTLSCFTNFGYRKIVGINRKIFWPGSDSNPKPTAWKRCCPNLSAVFFFLNIKFWSDKIKFKKELRPH